MFCVISLYKDRINGEITKKRARYNFKETKDEALKYMKNKYRETLSKYYKLYPEAIIISELSEKKLKGSIKCSFPFINMENKNIDTKTHSISFKVLFME